MNSRLVDFWVLPRESYLASYTDFSSHAVNSSNCPKQVTRALILGRQAGDKILPKFFPPLGSSLNRPALFLRALLWLVPCPEAGIMCVWSSFVFVTVPHAAVVDAMRCDAVRCVSLPRVCTL